MFDKNVSADVMHLKEIKQKCRKNKRYNNIGIQKARRRAKRWLVA